MSSGRILAIVVCHKLVTAGMFPCNGDHSSLTRGDRLGSIVGELFGYRRRRLAAGIGFAALLRRPSRGAWNEVIEPPSSRLRGIELLVSLPEPELRALEQRCRWRRYAAGQQIVDRSSENRDVFFVVEGSVRAVDFSPSGREVVYAVIGEGGHFGELSAIDGLARSASVIAVENCLLAALTPTQFDSLIRGQPEVAVALLRKLVGMIRTTDERLTEVTTLGAMTRVHRELSRLAQHDERTGAWLIAPMPTQRELAGLAGTTRETVARTLSQLTRDGLVRRSGRTLRILDKTALESAVPGYRSTGADGAL